MDHKGASWGATWIHPNWGQYYSLSYLGMARGFALAGDTAKARKAFQDFFELWKDADTDIPDTEASQGGIREAELSNRLVPKAIPVMLYLLKSACLYRRFNLARTGRSPH